jgi:NAD(P)-dependent dehydrogenase (short-subunit alcohol dehydrogenase family)
MSEVERSFRLDDRVAIITGGGTGIGAETARVFAAHGARGIVLAARTQANLDAVAHEISTASSARVLAVRTDVKDEDSVVAMVERAQRELGRIDVLVNNAGGTRMGPLEATPTRGWDAAFALNARGPFLCTREVGRHMIAQRSGSIVNISSDAGVSGVKHGAGYSAAKAALQMLTRVSAAEWGRHGIRVNCIAVGLVASERAVEGWKLAGIDPEKIAASTPLGRPGRPADIAYPILFLASDAAAFVTGQTLAVDGGPIMGGPSSAET